MLKSFFVRSEELYSPQHGMKRQGFWHPDYDGK